MHQPVKAKKKTEDKPKASNDPSEPVQLKADRAIKEASAKTKEAEKKKKSSK